MNSMPPLSDEARAALAAYRTRSPGAERAPANLSAVRGRLSAPSRAAAGGLAWTLGWTAASAATAAAVLVGVIRLTHVESQSSDPPSSEQAVDLAPRQPEAPTRDVSTTSPIPEVERPAALLAPSASSVEPSGTSAGGGGPSRPPRVDLVEETRLLRAVRAGIGSGDLDAATRNLDEHRRRFPRGALREDRDAYAVIVSCRGGKPSVRVRARFVSTYPQSPHLPRIADACDDRANDKK